MTDYSNVINCSRTLQNILVRRHSKSTFVVEWERGIFKKGTVTNRRGVKPICTFAVWKNLPYFPKNKQLCKNSDFYVEFKKNNFFLSFYSPTLHSKIHKSHGPSFEREGGNSVNYTYDEWGTCKTNTDEKGRGESKIKNVELMYFLNAPM